MTQYAVTAQFYDAVSVQAHEAVHARMAGVLAGRETGGYPIVDIGAGTGLTTQAIARALPDTEIFAIEPDAAMRPALMTRVCADADLRRRVSILPMSVLTAPLPPIISVAIASASLVHFSPQERNALWALFAERLSDDGYALIEIQCPVAEDVAETRLTSACVGQVEYEAWAGARRIDTDRQQWRMTYITRIDGIEIDRQSTEFTCWTTSAEQVLAEAHAHGLAGSSERGLVALRKT